MQITSKTVRQCIRGFALTITLILMTVMLTIFASIMFWVSSNSKVTMRNNQYNMSQAAAEAAVERVMAQMDRDFLNGSLTNASSYEVLLPDQSSWPVKYQFSDNSNAVGKITVSLGTTTTNSVPLYSQYQGLSGQTRDCTIIAIAAPTNEPANVSAKITEFVQFALIDIFQYAIFYNVNLEIAPGAAMTINGSVFCNQSIWEGSDNATFASTVTAVGTNCTASADPFALNYSKTGGSHFTLAGQPTTSANAIVMPVGTNNNPSAVRAILEWPPAAYSLGTDPAYSTNGQNYTANQADIIITNAVNGTNFPGGFSSYDMVVRTNQTVVYFQDSVAVGHIFWVTNDLYLISNKVTHTPPFVTNTVKNLNLTTNVVLYAGYSFLTNDTFVDWREGWNGGSGPAKTVQCLQIDVAKFGTWLTNALTNSAGVPLGGKYYNDKCVTDKGRAIGGVYVYNYVPRSSTRLPAVRVVNGQKLPAPGNSKYGFTVATPFPMYVQGDYNVQTNGGVPKLGLTSTASTYPAALMADSITVLSTSWDDSTTTKMPGAGSTTVNAAMLEGIVQTDPTISGDYSGGVENFIRLLEDWNGDTLTYNGSIVVMFYSQYATNHWVNTGNYYNPPGRNWAFDTNFKQADKLPPMTPKTRALVRGQWTAQ